MLCNTNHENNIMMKKPDVSGFGKADDNKPTNNDQSLMIVKRPWDGVSLTFIDLLQLFQGLLSKILKVLGVKVDKLRIPKLKKVQANWFKLLVIVVCTAILFLKDWQIEFSINGPGNSLSNGITNKMTDGLVSKLGLMSLESNSTTTWEMGEVEKIMEEKEWEVYDYISRFSQVAVNEMDKYGIPASIKMAQGILESSGGTSLLVQESKNHFGIKCKTKCTGCTCRNYADDDRYDMFRVFETDWESWRAHSLLLAGSERYQELKKYGTNYKKWAMGLQEAGYATDPQYGKKLIRLIEKYKLMKLDGAY